MSKPPSMKDRETAAKLCGIYRVRHDMGLENAIAEALAAQRDEFHDVLAGVLGYLGVLANGQTICGLKHVLASRYSEEIQRAIDP